MTVTEPQRLRKPSAPNSARHRTGSSKGTHSGLRRGQLPVEKDSVVMARIDQGQELMLRGFSVSEIAGQQGVSPETVYLDRRRSRQMARDRILTTKEEIVGGLREVRRASWDAFNDTANSSLNKSAYLSVARQSLMDEHKVGGLEEVAKVEVTLRNGSLEHLDEEIERRLRQRMDALAGKPRLVVESTNGVAKLGPGRTEAP